MTKLLTNAGVALEAPVFEWDEPEGCTTPRGWCFWDNHDDAPDPYSESGCVGNYCTYNFPGGTRGPKGETVHACAYVFRYWGLSRMRSHIGLGFAWFQTADEAKRFIEGNVRAYLGLPREADPCRTQR
jgi:hypothetical protein